MKGIMEVLMLLGISALLSLYMVGYGCVVLHRGTVKWRGRALTGPAAATIGGLALTFGVVSLCCTVYVLYLAFPDR